ncbi:MAG: hypothetical protein AAF636_25265 [Pseudomonadota bacterium]
MKPLGFADLTDDEALIVGLFRDWRLFGAALEQVGGYTISAIWSDDSLVFFPKIFLDFDQLTGAELAPTGVGDLLSPIEELLLDHVSNRPPASASAFNDECPSRHRFNVRPIQETARSGKDELISRIQSSYVRVAHGV